MKVLYDISPLALGHADPKGRAGIFRVAEEVAVGLAGRLGGDLGLCTAGRPDLESAGRDYLAGEPRLGTVRFEAAPAGALPPYRWLRAGRDRLAARAAGGGGAWRAAHRLAHKAARAVEVAAGPLPRSARGRYDVFHSPYDPIPQAVRRGRRPPACVLTAYDVIPLLFPQFYPLGYADHFATIWRGVRPDDWVVSISAATRRDLCERFPHIDPARVAVAPLAASGEFYPCADAERVAAVRRRCGVPDGARYLLSLNTLEPRKNVDHTLRCFARVLRQERPDGLYLVLAGGRGWQYDRIFAELEAFAGPGAAAELRGRVLVAGRVPDEDLAPLYTGALAFVYPSLYEGFGLPPLEAMRCGTPVVVSDNSSLPEVVGDAGILVPATDADALCDAMLRLDRDAGLRADLARRSVARAAAFSWDACVGKTMDVYRAAADGRG